MNQILSLRRGTGATGAGTCLATVTESSGGRARAVRCADGTVRAVAGHGAAVPRLRAGDTVLVVPVEAGCIVTDRLLAPDEPPAARVVQHDDGSVSIWAEGAIRLHTRGGIIEVDRRGRVAIHGRELRLRARGRLRLLARAIGLN